MNHIHQNPNQHQVPCTTIPLSMGELQRAGTGVFNLEIPSVNTSFNSLFEIKFI